MQAQRSNQGVGPTASEAAASPTPLQSLYNKPNQYVRQSPVPQQPAFSRQSPAWQNQYEQTFNQAMQADRQRQIDAANKTVDDKLAARQGYYATPQQRQSGFFQRGMGPMPVRQAEPTPAMTFNPERNAQANNALYRQHVDSMKNNPAYANRVNRQRMDQQAQLDTRSAIANARRMGAIQAAGASQQMRNLMAGRGALAGQDGFNAMASLAAMQNPNQAFGDYGQAYMAQMAPNMLGMRLAADERMLDRRADLSRMNQYEDMRMRIISSGAPDMEKQRALQSLDSHIMSSGVMRGSGGAPQPLSQIGREAGMEAATNQQSPYVPPSDIPLPSVDPNDMTTPTVTRYANYMQSLRNEPAWLALSPEQQAEFLKRVQSQFFPGIQRSDMEQRQQDLQVNPLARLQSAGARMLGIDAPSMTRRQEQLDALNPYIPGSIPYREGQHVLTDEEEAAVGELPDSRDRRLYERLLRNGMSRGSNPDANPLRQLWNYASGINALSQ